MARTHYIELRPVRPFRNNAAWSFGDGSISGVSRQPLLDAARRLLEEGIAQPSDTIASVWRDGSVALSARVEVAARLTVAEEDAAGLRFRRWKPYTVARAAPPVSETGADGCTLPKTKTARLRVAPHREGR